MSGEQILPLRLSPSGAEMLDATSQQPLQAGQGTPGLVWRGQYSGNPAVGTDIGGQFATPVVLPGMGGAWALANGYFYDAEVEMTVQAGAGVTINDLVLILEGSIDGGATWTVGLGVFVWNNTGLLGSEAATYMNGTLRFPTTVDITDVRARAGADGAAGNRLVFGGFLHIEQYTEGDEPEPIRLSPSGGFLEDATTNLPAQVGSGTPGLVWRAVTSGAPLDVGGVVPQLVGGLTNAWAIPAGYRYDVQFFGDIADAAAGATGDLRFVVEGSSDSGATYFTILDQTIPNTILAAGEGREYFAGLMAYVPNVDITNIRTSLAGGVAGRFLENGWLKIQQYVQ